MKLALVSIFVLALAGLAFWMGKRTEQAQSEIQREGWQREKKELEIRAAEFQEKLIQNEQALSKLAEDLKKAQPEKKTLEVVVAPVQTVPVTQKFIDRFNQTLEKSGLRDWKLQEAETVSQGRVAGASFFKVGSNGAVAGMVSAKSCKLYFPPVAGVIWLELEDGFEIENGEKKSFSDGTYRIELAPVDVDFWKKSLPELFVSSPEPSTVVPQADQGSEGTPLLERLNALKSGFRFTRIGSVRNGELRDVEMIQLANGLEPERKLKAAVAQIKLDEERQTVELILKKGSQEKEGQTIAFPPSGFRILLSKLKPKDWQNALGSAAH